MLDRARAGPDPANLCPMRFLVSGETYNARYDFQSPWRRVRTRFCVALGALLSIGIAALGPAVRPGVTWLANLVVSHAAWTLSPVVACVVGALVYGYLFLGQFFEEDSPWVIAVTCVIAIAVAVGIAGLCDGQWKVHLERGSIMIALAAVVIGLVFMLALRRLDVDQLEAFWVITVPLAVLLFGPALYVLARVLASGVPWSHAWHTAASALAGRWALILSPIVGLVQAPAWRQRARERAQADRPTGYTRTGRDVRLFAIAVVSALLVVYGVLYQLPELLVHRDGLTNSQFRGSIAEERRTLLAVLGAVGAAVTLVYTHLRHQLDRDANATGRYTEAVQQLGSESMSIRLGGIYALARVARDSPSDSKTVTEVLAAFVRDGTRSHSGGIDLDVMAALTELAKAHTRDFPQEDRFGSPVSDMYVDPVDLRSSQLSGGNFDGVVFPSRVDLRKSNLTGATFNDARISRSSLGEVDAANTHFKRGGSRS